MRDNVVARWTLVVVTAAGLAVDAYTHFETAHNYTYVRSSSVNEAVLFRIEAVIAIVAALALIVRANLLTAVFALLVAGGGLFLLVLYRYVNVGAVGPVPDMYEPLWKPFGNTKIASALGEAVAVVAALALIGLLLHARIARRRSVTETV